MFALEISFSDGVSQPEMIFVRRPQALIGASDYAHVVVDDMRDLNYQLRLIRDVGERFQIKVLPDSEQSVVPHALEGTYEGAASINLGAIRLFVTALDTDLLVKDGEPPDKAGVRVLRRAFVESTPRFPAVVVAGDSPMVVSFAPDQSLLIGRAKQCALRLDSADISARHARLTFEQGEFFIEDLGSTNGTFIGEQQVSGRARIMPGQPVLLGREISIVPVLSEEEVARAGGIREVREEQVLSGEQRYPVLVSASQVARPARVVLSPGAAVTIGRDPASDMWLGAPHVSRKHCSIIMNHAGEVSLTDHSTNGTAYDDGFLQRGDVLELRGVPRVLDFGNSVTVAVCFSSDQEQAFLAAQGNVHVFTHAHAQGSKSSLGRPLTYHGLRAAAQRVELQGAPNLLQQLRIMFASLNTIGKLLLAVTVFCFIGLLVVLGTILSGVLL